MPLGHARQSSAFRERFTFWNVAAGHKSHALWPAASWYDPGAHGSHRAAPALAPNVPGEHATHWLLLVAPPNPRNSP